MTTTTDPIPTCAELCARATQGPRKIHPANPMDDSISDIKSGEQTVCSTCPDDCNYREWKEGEEEANAQLIARLSPEVVMEIHDSARIICKYAPPRSLEYDKAQHILHLLDGIAPERK